MATTGTTVAVVESTPVEQNDGRLLREFLRAHVDLTERISQRTFDAAVTPMLPQLKALYATHVHGCCGGVASTHDDNVADFDLLVARLLVRSEDD